MRRVGQRAPSAGALIVLLAGFVLPASASADGITFRTTGNEQTFVVPAGVTLLHVAAVGGRGSDFEMSNGRGVVPGGFGASVSADLPVTPGQTLYIEVAGNGATDSGSAFGGGGPSFAGGGGGASDVRTSPAATPEGFGSRLIVAAGGGGAASNARGGAAGEAGCGEGFLGGNCLPGGGGAGTLTAGGAGGQLFYNGANRGFGGGPGSLGQGGEGATGYVGPYGGGGGGGLYGGGGGASQADVSDNFQHFTFGPTAGGGGSSWADPRAANPVIGADTSGAPSVTFTYQAAPPPPPSNEFTIGQRQSGKRGALRLLVTVPGPGKIQATAKAASATYATSSATAGKAGTTALRLVPRPRALKLLAKRRRLPLSIDVTFTPVGGSPRTSTIHQTVRAGRR